MESVALYPYSHAIHLPRDVNILGVHHRLSLHTGKQLIHYYQKYPYVVA